MGFLKATQTVNGDIDKDVYTFNTVLFRFIIGSSQVHAPRLTDIGCTVIKEIRLCYLIIFSMGLVRNKFIIVLFR